MDYLHRHGVAYTRIPHPETFTAQEAAQRLHVPGMSMAKVVIVRLDATFAMAVVPAPHAIDFAKLQKITGSGSAALASESELQVLFPDCETGAMPPYGNLYGLPVLVARPLARGGEIVFEAGSHHEALRVSYGDFARLATPTVLDFTTATPH